jgi:predicted  nucleic acid-binding Zn-ribbon protein
MTDDARQYRNQISPREDRILELYDIVDAATATLAAANARLAEAQQAHAATQAELNTERAALTAQVGQQEQDREAVTSQTDPQSLRLYDGLRRTRGGLAVAEVAQRTCQGCRVSLPANLETRARTSEDLVLCQSCGRILHSGY